MTKAEEQIKRIKKQLDTDCLTKELIERGFGEIILRINDGKFILIENHFKSKPQEN